MAVAAKKSSKRATVATRSREILQGPEEHFVPEARLIAALVNEIARGRARHRALLDLLERSGTIELADYIAEYRSLEAQDFVPFVELLLLSKDQFAEKHPSWIQENVARFGYDGSSRAHLTLERQAEVSEGSTRTAFRKSTERKPRTRKAK